jgi:hypothetical protein
MSEPSADQDLRALLRSSSDVPEMPADARQRVRARLQNVIDVAGAAPAPTGRALAPGSSVVANSITAAAIGMLGGIVVGIAIGWTAASSQLSDTVSHPPQRETTRSESTSSSSTPARTTPPNERAQVAPAPLLEREGDDAQHSPSTTERRSSTGQSPRPTHGDPATNGASLAAERRLIDAAFAALRRGNRVEALRALDRHEERFPEGILAREREELRARALRGQPEPPSP